MIEYVEIRAKATRDIIGIVDTAKSIIWHACYYDNGDFEIYAPASQSNLSLLTVGNYVTRPDDVNVGFIEKIEITYNRNDGRMIIASGRFAKCILSRRVIYILNPNSVLAYSVSPTFLNGNVETAARKLITDNAINCTFERRRNIPILVLGEHSGSTQIIVDEDGNAATKQVTYENLNEYVNTLLREYSIGSRVVLNNALKFQFECYEGVNRSIDNQDGNEPVIFSQNFDSLISSDFIDDETGFVNMAIVAGEGEGIERIVGVVYQPRTLDGFERREIYIDASSSSRSYEEDGEQKEIPINDYMEQLHTIGLQTLANSQIVQSLNGEINIYNDMFKYGVNFNLGDIITIEDNALNLHVNTRIIEITEVQDENGYNITAVYGS